MRDDRTQHLNLPVPSLENELQEDCPRIREALQVLDTNAGDQKAEISGLEKLTDEQGKSLSSLEGRATELENRAAACEGRTSALEKGVAEKADAAATTGELERLEADKATREEMAAHDADKDAHDALVQRITVGSLSPVIGICCVETGGGAGLWCNVDGEGQPVSPTRRYFDYHPTYNALRRVLVDSQVMQEHHKFYYKAFTIASGPFQGKTARVISPGQQDGFKPFPSFMRDGKEADVWYCGTYAATDEGGTPKKLGSRPGKMPFVSVDFPTMKSYCHNRNVGGVNRFEMWNIYQVSELQLLALIEAATPDTQAVYGRGRVDATSAATVDALDVATASWRGHVGLWGNVWQMVDGIDVTPAGTLRLWKNDGVREFVDTGFVCPAYDGTNVAYMQTFKTGAGAGFDFDDIFFPATTTTNILAGTVPDGFWGRWGSAGNVLYLGGAWSNGSGAGLFCQDWLETQALAGTYIGCRLAKV